MVVYVGGDKSVFESVSDILDASYINSIHTGAVGTAMIPKVASNMLCCVNAIAMGEVLMLGTEQACACPFTLTLPILIDSEQPRDPALI